MFRRIVLRIRLVGAIAVSSHNPATKNRHRAIEQQQNYIMDQLRSGSAHAKCSFANSSVIRVATPEKSAAVPPMSDKAGSGKGKKTKTHKSKPQKEGQRSFVCAVRVA